MKGIVKFLIQKPVTCLTFNPVTPKLLACADNKVSKWYPKIKQVVPLSVDAAVLCAAWSSDGKSYAIGLADKTILILDSINDSQIYKYCITNPVSAIAMSNDLLFVGIMDYKLVIYKPSEFFSISCQNIPSQPSTILKFLKNMLFTYVNGKVTLSNADGQFITEIADVKECIRSASVSDDGYLALGLDNGAICVYSLGKYLALGLDKGAVHIYSLDKCFDPLSIYSQYRDVFVLITENTKIQIRIIGTDKMECIESDITVDDVSVTETMFAFRCGNEISTYSLEKADVYKNLYIDELGNFNINFKYFKFFIFCNSLVFYLGKSIKIYSISGEFIREFTFPANVRSVAIFSAVPGKESILAGLENGKIYMIQVFINKQLMRALIKHDKPIEKIAVSMNQSKISVVDCDRRCCVYDAVSANLLYIENCVDVCVWNELCDDLVAFSDGEKVFVKPYFLENITVNIEGKLIRFAGLKLYLINGTALVEIDVSLSTSVKALSQAGDFRRAYELAKFGLSDESWDELADAALRAKEMSIATNSALHSKNVELLHSLCQEQEKLIEKLEEEKQNDQNEIKKLNNEKHALEQKSYEPEKNKLKKENDTIQVPQEKSIEILDTEDIQNLEIIEEIGFGGNGIIYKVAKKTIYALKKMRPQITHDEFKHFIQEYELMRILEHPNIVKTHGIFMSDKQNPPSILLEYCPSNLDLLIKNKQATNVEIVFIIYQIVEGMKYVHFRNIVHRDLKPTNILIGEDGTVKIGDFGISKLMSSEEQMTLGLGTFNYMAPEILNQEEYNEKVDVYAFGVILFFILSGGKSPEITIIQVGNGKKAKIPDTFTEFSSQLISSCWNFNPKDRPSFEKIYNDIENKEFNLIEMNETEIDAVKKMIKHHKEKVPNY